MQSGKFLDPPVLRGRDPIISFESADEFSLRQVSCHLGDIGNLPIGIQQKSNRFLHAYFYLVFLEAVAIDIFEIPLDRRVADAVAFG